MLMKCCGKKLWQHLQKIRSMKPETAHEGKTGWTKDELQDH